MRSCGKKRMRRKGICILISIFCCFVVFSSFPSENSIVSTGVPLPERIVGILLLLLAQNFYVYTYSFLLHIISLSIVVFLSFLSCQIAAPHAFSSFVLSTAWYVPWKHGECAPHFMPHTRACMYGNFSCGHLFPINQCLVIYFEEIQLAVACFQAQWIMCTVFLIRGRWMRHEV